MRSVLRSTLILSSSSVITILVGLISAKAGAMLLGPVGLGVMGLLQTVIAIGSLATGIGVSTGVVRFGAGALAHGDQRRVAALARAAWLWLVVLGGIAALALVALSRPLSRLVFGTAEQALSMALMGPALIFTLAGGVQAAILNAHHRVGALARLQVLTSLLGTGASLVLIWAWGRAGIAPALIIAPLLNWLVAAALARREQIQPPARPSLGETLAAARELLRFALPYTASMLVGTGVQMAIPLLIVYALEASADERAAAVGFYRAATTISVSYLGFLLTALTQDYYPRVSAISDQPAALADLVNQQHRLVLLLTGPIIFATLALAPFLVPLVYSAQFMPTVELLEWYLLGDLLKFASWTMGFVILARSGSLTLFLIELLAGANILISSWLGVRILGLAGLGVGFLFTYSVHYLVVWWVVRGDLKLIWSRANLRLLWGSIAAAALIRILPMVGLEPLRTPVALGIATLGGLVAAQLLWRDLGGARSLRAWLRRAT